MNKIKRLAFAVSGALLVSAGFVSCDNDEVSASEINSSEVQAKKIHLILI